MLLAAGPGLLDVKKWPDRSVFIAIGFRADMHYSWILYESDEILNWGKNFCRL